MHGKTQKLQPIAAAAKHHDSLGIDDGPAEQIGLGRIDDGDRIAQFMGNGVQTRVNGFSPAFTVLRVRPNPFLSPRE
jgi:hypothetical protein